MNIKHLRHLLAIAETGSFSRAADRTYITQSALSRSIQSLEEELGGALIDRIGKKNELTPLGHEVVAQAQGLVLAAEELRRRAIRFSLGGKGEIQVGLGSGPGAMLMTPLLQEATISMPDVRVSLWRGSTELQLLQLRSRELEALVIDARRVSPAPDLSLEPLGEMRTGFIAASSHPLAKKRKVKFEELLDFPIASTPLSADVARLLVEQYGAKADPQLMITLRCEDIKSLIDTVAKTNAIYLGIVAAARDGIEAASLSELAISPQVAATARFAYVTLRGRTEAPAMRWFREFVSVHLRD
jgi:DNA-binding transcriptional LysR family regulator